jgi:hypothetical protein
VERYSSIYQDASSSSEQYRLGIDYLAIQPELEVKIWEGLAKVDEHLVDQRKALGLGLFPLREKIAEQHGVSAPSVALSRHLRVPIGGLAQLRKIVENWLAKNQASLDAGS